MDVKTAAAVLQEMAVKAGTTPEYECVAQSGPQHMSLFEYHCEVLGCKASAVARSKKEAKQEAARAMLRELAARGHSVPAPWGQPGRAPAAAGAGLAGAAAGAGPGGLDAHSYVALLKEYCEEYRLPEPSWTLVGDSGPPHLRSFTMRVAVGAHTRDATALSKKAARQAAAEAVYKYLRGCLRSTQDFVEADAIIRAIDRKLGRADERKDVPWRPPLDQRLAEYQCGLALQFGEGQRAAALGALRDSAGQPATVQLGCALSALGLEAAWGELPSTAPDGRALATVELPTTSPALLFAAADRELAAADMIHYLEQFLMNPPKDPFLELQDEASQRLMQVDAH